MNIIERVFIICMIILSFILLINFIVTSPRFSLIDMSSYDFCVSQGYDSNSLDGGFSEKFGKVKCVSCYNRECIYEEFNVTKDWRGRIKLK